MLLAPSQKFLFHFLDRAKLLLPEPLEVSRDKAVLGLARMILSLGACRLVPRSLDTQLPLPFKRRRFSFELFQSAKRQRNAIWLERRQDQPFDLGVHRQALDLLTART